MTTVWLLMREGDEYPQNPTVVGVFSNQEEAQSTGERLQREYWHRLMSNPERAEKALKGIPSDYFVEAYELDSELVKEEWGG